MGVFKARVWLNILLLLVLVSLCVWVYRLAPEGEDIQTLALLAEVRGNIHTIKIQRPPQETPPSQPIVLKRQADRRWQMLEPIAQSVDQIKMKQLLSLIDERVSATYPATPERIQQFGLSPAQALRVQYNDEVLWLGASNPVSHQRYVLHNQQIKLVAESVTGLLRGGVNALVTKALLNVAPNQ